VSSRGISRDGTEGLDNSSQAFCFVFQLTRIPDTVAAQLDRIVSRLRGGMF
jgi:hypothetical protein